MTTTFDWTAVAPAWDTHREHAGRSTVPVAAALVRGLALTPGAQVLELAAGTGDLARRLVDLVGPTGRVLATDAAPGMVALSAGTLRDCPNATAALADATVTGLPSAAFDAVACCMGLMFVPDPAAALAECHRVLAPGGRLAAAVWAGPAENLWVASVGMSAGMHGLAVGGPPTGPGGLFSLADPATLADLASSAGFHDVTVEPVPVEFRYASTDEHFDVVTSLGGPLAALLAAATEEQRAAVRATTAEIVEGSRAADGSLLLAGKAWVLSATA